MMSTHLYYQLKSFIQFETSDNKRMKVKKGKEKENQSDSFFISAKRKSINTISYVLTEKNKNKYIDELNFYFLIST